MEAYLPMIQSILSDWYRFTLENQEYAGALALAVWLLTAMFYSIRIYFLKKTNAINLKARLALQADLEAAQQQQQALQEQLTANTEQMEAAKTVADNEAQRAAGLEEKLVQANRQVIDSIKTLASGFELTEPALPAANDLQSTDLWPRYFALTAQIAERFKAEQQGKTELQLALWAETSKLAEKDALIGPLQLRLESQTEQLNKLELAVEEQKILRERDQASAEKLLADTIAKHQAELARYADSAKHSAAPAVAHAQPVSQPEPKVVISEAPAVIQPSPAVVAEPAVVQAPVEQPKPVEREVAPVVDKPKPVVAEPAPAKQSSVDKLAEKSGGFGKFKQMLNNTMQQMAKLDQKLGTQTEVAAETIQEELEEIAAPIMEAAVELKENVVEIAETAAEAVKEPAAGVGGKLKNLFGKSKSEEPVAESAPAVVEPEPIVEIATAIVEPAKPAGLKGLLKKWK
jgi:flagellar hook-basal body complex protein FliE